MNNSPDNTEWVLEYRPISSLRPHPLNAKAFNDFAAADLRTLADDIARRGLQQPIDVLPSNVILSGHQRVRAYQLLELEEIPCRVRHDLENDPIAVIRHLVDENLTRRQLTSLEVVRAIVERETAIGRTEGYHTRINSFTPLIADQLKTTERTARRYLAVLRTPHEVQAAFEAGALSIVEAGRVAQLALPKQAEVATKLRRGESAKEVVKAACRKGRFAEEVTMKNSVQDHLRELGRLSSISLATLEQGQSLSGSAVKRLRQATDALRTALDPIS